MIQKYFNRFELKFQISLQERDRIIRNIKPFIEFDDHIKNNFNYEVRSLYYESPFRNLYLEKNSGVMIRFKVRIRYYPDFQNDGEEYVFIELKRKTNNNISKSRILVPFENSLKIIDSNTDEAKAFYKNASNQDKKKLNEIWFLYKRYLLRPYCVVCYKRQPFLSKFEKTFRITFDTNVKIRNFNFDLHIGGGIKYIVPRHICIMEVKFNSFIPKWAVQIIQKYNCIQEKISKYASGLEKTKVFCVI